MKHTDTTDKETDEIYNESSTEEFDIYTQDVERTARNMAHLMGVEEKEETLDNIVFSLQKSLADTNAGNPVNFSDILTTNTRILNAAFEYYLDKAKDARAPDEKISLALRAQSQLIRSIATWKRIASMHNGGTK